MADDINKKITIDVQVNSDGLQEINKYSGAVADLGASFGGLSEALSKALSDITSVNKGAAKAAAAVDAGIKAATDGAKKIEEAKSKTAVGVAIQTAGKILSIRRILAKSTKALDDKGRADQLKSELDNVQKISDATFNIITKGIDRRRDAEVAGMEERRKDIDQNQSMSAADKKKAEQKIYNDEYQVKLKAFKQDQRANIAQAIMNGALAVTKSEADLGPIAGTIAIAAIVAQTAAQIATIKAQQPPVLQRAAKGGYFKSDGKGAVLPGYSKTDNVNAYIRSGEAVVVSEAMRDPWARNLVSAINVAYGGRDFSVPNLSKGYAVGGIFTDGGNANRYYNQPMNDNKNLANTIAYQMINNFPPVYVDVKDINNQQNILAQTVNRVNL
ncbi:MAG: hypothetical protein JSU01_16625 [Bacteroidetes bacterium]|nr:hypothetical protein [Bacteroidota bacterium]